MRLPHLGIPVFLPPRVFKIFFMVLLWYLPDSGKVLGLLLGSSLGVFVQVPSQTKDTGMNELVCDGECRRLFVSCSTEGGGVELD